MENKYINLNIKEERTKALLFLKEVLDIFKKNNINVWLNYGTLLGAIRNNSMIPWDCEFDLGVNKKEIINNKNFFSDLNIFYYKVLPDRIKIYKKGWIYGSYNIDIGLYEIDDKHAKKFHELQPKNIISKYIYSIRQFIENIINEHYQIRMQDIYKILMYIYKNNIDNIENNSFKIKKYRKNAKSSFIIKIGKYKIISPSIILFKKKSIKNAIQIVNMNLGYLIISLIPYTFLTILDNYLSEIDNKFYNKFYSIKYVIIPASFFLQFKEIQYYDIKVNIPKDSEKYLKLIYGPDWKIPKHNWNIRNNINVLKAA